MGVIKNLEIMKNLFLIIFVLFLMINTVFGQKIVIDTNGLFLNSRQISKQSPPDSIVSILGSPDRTFALYNTIWTYDDLGLLI